MSECGVASCCFNVLSDHVLLQAVLMFLSGCVVLQVVLMSCLVMWCCRSLLFSGSSCSSMCWRDALLCLEHHRGTGVGGDVGRMK